MIGIFGSRRVHGIGNAHHGLERPAEELLLRQHACPGIEELHRLGAGVDLMTRSSATASTRRSISRRNDWGWR